MDAGPSDPPADRFVDWFKQHGTQHPALGLTHFEGMGRGAVALEDIPEDTILFSIPRKLLLNTANSKLYTLLSESELATLRNWTPLILSMMWENLQADSLWKPYFDVMPVAFDSLMFWEEQQLKELEGSSILTKIGKQEAMEDYHEVIKPLVEAKPDIFNPPSACSEDLYNRMGSLILSRSFHVDKTDDDEDDDSNDGEGGAEDVNDAGDASNASLLQATEAMDVHNETSLAGGADDDETGIDIPDDDEEDERESVNSIAMVPWADMLNARHGCDNARLFHEKDCLNMTTTKAIKKGEQIWNVYGDPPNSDLLRRYGHVDAVNPSDIAEITADLIADVVCTGSDREERIETLLEADLDDTYTFTLQDHEESMLEFLSAVAVFKADRTTLEKIQRRGKVPTKGLKEDLPILKLARTIFERRLALYPHDFTADQKKLSSLESSNTQDRRLYSAIVVRHGEMRILQAILEELEQGIQKREPAAVTRKDATEESQGASKPRIASRKEQREEKKRVREEEKLLNGVGGSSKKQRR